MKIGILGGSFNPIHIGHCILASYICQNTDLDEMWLSVSPQNPFKADRQMLQSEHRLRMVELATECCPALRPCGIELELPLPSYTINTLHVLQERYPGNEFKIIIGSDNWERFGNWKCSQQIMDDFGVIIYPRHGYAIEEPEHPNVRCIDAPLIEISSTYIRESIKKGKNMNFFLPEKVYQYITQNNLYK